MRHPTTVQSVSGSVVFQICSSAYKHVANITHLMSALEARGQASVALCWSAAERICRRHAAIQVATIGLKFVQLERFATFAGLVESFRRSREVTLRARHQSGAVDFLRYRGITLAPLLQQSLRHFFVAELPQRIRYARALTRSIGNARPLAVKPWGGANLFEGKLLIRLTSSVPDGTLFVHYWVGTALEWPYAERKYVPGLFLAKSAHEAELAAQEFAIDSKCIKIVGASRFENYREFEQRHSAESSRQSIGVPARFRYYVGFDPACPIRGIQCYRDQVMLLRALLEVAATNESVMLVIKPHQSCSINHLANLLEVYRLKNLKVLAASAPAEHFLNSIDLLVTKFSTLILEATLLGKPTISVILDGEARFKILGNVPLVLGSCERLKALLIHVLSESGNFAAWKAAVVKRARSLLPHYYCEAPTGAAVAGAAAIIDQLGLRGPRDSSGLNGGLSLSTINDGNSRFLDHIE